MDDKQRIALVETRKEVDDGSPERLMRYQLGNHLGSASVDLDEGGALIAYEDYHPYGTTAFQAGRSAVEVKLKRYRYTGKERDEESGLCYHRARYYAPWFGRWASCDPGGLVDASNLYVYTLSNPLRFVDPTGRETKSSPQNKILELRFGQGWGKPESEFREKMNAEVVSREGPFHFGSGQAADGKFRLRQAIEEADVLVITGHHYVLRERCDLVGRGLQCVGPSPGLFHFETRSRDGRQAPLR